jgi:hypothetical protein
VTAEDVQRVARQYFINNGRTSGSDFQPAASGGPSGQPAAQSGEKP